MNKNRDEKKTSNCDCLANATRGWVAKAPFYSHVPTDIMLGFAGKTKKKAHAHEIPQATHASQIYFSQWIYTYPLQFRFQLDWLW